MSTRPKRAVGRAIFIPLFLVVAVVACLVAAYFVLTKPVNNKLNPIESAVLGVEISKRAEDLNTLGGTDDRPVCFTVNPGDNATTIGTNLAQQGFVKDADLFRKYARYYGVDVQFQTGVYLLRRTLTIPEVANTLTNAGANTSTFQTIEGQRIEEIAQTIDHANPPLAFQGTDFLQMVGPGAASRSALVKDFATRAGIPNGKSLEGFLFPDTYTLPACSHLDALVSRMLQNFDNKLTAQMR